LKGHVIVAPFFGEAKHYEAVDNNGFCIVVGVMAMKVVSRFEDLEAAKEEWYERLSEFMVRLVEWSDVSVVLEAGCGSGRLTMPLVAKIGKRCRFIAYDLSAGPYEGDLEILREGVLARGIGDVVETIYGDVRDMKTIANKSVDLIISHELFCELNRVGLELASKEFYRILKPKGQMVHAELSPVGENRAQELLIEANLSYSLETMLPECSFWFSPTVDDVAVLMRKTGFKDIRAYFFEVGLRFSYPVAIEQLTKWNIDSRFMEKYGKELREHGIEFPLEHVVVCKKSKTES